MAQKHVEIIDFPETRVAILEHQGDSATLTASVKKFVEWRKQLGLHPSKSATYNIVFSHDIDSAEFRYGLCAAYDGNVMPNAYGIAASSIPMGRCAVVRHIGPDETLAEDVRYLYTEWLPQSGETLREFPLFLRRVQFPPEVQEDATVIDIHLPIR